MLIFFLWSVLVIFSKGAPIDWHTFIENEQSVVLCVASYMHALARIACSASEHQIKTLHITATVSQTQRACSR